MRKHLIYLLIGLWSCGYAQHPGGVSSDLRLWYTAGTGTTSSTDNSTTFKWDDQSGNGYNAWTTGTMVFKDNATDNINFNPTLYFDGSSRFNLNNIGIRSGGYLFGNPIYD